jgi:hypothetical protein
MIFALKDGKQKKDINGFNTWWVESGLSVEVTQVKITFLHCHSHYHPSLTLYTQTS